MLVYSSTDNNEIQDIKIFLPEKLNEKFENNKIFLQQYLNKNISMIINSVNMLDFNNNPMISAFQGMFNNDLLKENNIINIKNSLNINDLLKDVKIFLNNFIQISNKISDLIGNVPMKFTSEEIDNLLNDFYNLNKIENSNFKNEILFDFFFNILIYNFYYTGNNEILDLLFLYVNKNKYFKRYLLNITKED